ncbi:MAG: hypothetical protein LRY73_17235 [Bacillus sp. (in: Bacteria)]|nr:hypothetical protein [Bacillus sp. (in: firmicutes)]
MKDRKKDFINNETHDYSSEISNPDISTGNMETEFAYEVHAEDLAKRSIREVRYMEDIDTEKY